MGIRINKILGYGLKNVKFNKDHELIDPRFNTELFEDYDIWDKLDDYKKFIKKPDDCFILLKELGLLYELDSKLDVLVNIQNTYKQEPRLNMYDGETITYKIVIFTPPEYGKEWYRHDDIIDYTEDRITGSCVCRLVDLIDKGISGIYPFEGSYALIPGRKNKLNGNNTGYMSSGTYKLLMETTNSKHIQTDWGIKIPISIRLLTAFLGVFKDPRTVFELRPMYLKYWG